MTERPITKRRFLELLGYCAGILVIWSGGAIFAASEFDRRSVTMGGGHQAIKDILQFQMTTSLLWAIFTPIVIAIAERLPLRKPHLVRNTLAVLLFLPYIAVIRAVVGSVALNLGEGNPVSSHLIWVSIAIRTHRNVAIAAVIIIFTNLVMARREAASRARREVAAQTLLARAQLHELRAQMQPHFLFLTLRTIGEVVHTDPAAADDMVVGLADLLRRSLDLGTDAIPLAEELEFVDRYLALYRVCFGGRLAVRFHADEEVLNARVPPLLVQQLAESAVVNGIAPAGGGELAIHAWSDGDRLHLDVRDGGLGIATRDDEGALAPVRARLEKLFGVEQSLRVNRGVEGVVAAVMIPLDATAEAAFELEDDAVMEAV